MYEISKVMKRHGSFSVSRRKRFICISAAVIAVSLLFSACAKDTQGNAGDAEAAGAAASETVVFEKVTDGDTADTKYEQSGGDVAEASSVPEDEIGQAQADDKADAPETAEPAEEAETLLQPHPVLGDEQPEEYLPLLEGKRVALFSNSSGIVGDVTVPAVSADDDPEGLLPFGFDASGAESGFGEHIIDALVSRGVDVTVILSPEHGFRGEADAGEQVDDSVDEKTGIPIMSLYGAGSVSVPAGCTDLFDVMVADIQDVGLRYYTYYITLYRLMDACAESGKEVVILDRPNPNGFYVDGPILKEGYTSGVGVLPIPVVHGMTLGELALMINGEGWLKAGRDACELTVIPCRDYDHSMKPRLVTRPSPNLKDMRSVWLYSSLCFFENTAVSVGRGTEHPFEIFGSPYIEGSEGFDFSFMPESMAGAKDPPFRGQTCFGRDLRELPAQQILEEGIDLTYLTEAYEAVRAARPDISFFGSPDAKGRYWIDLLSGSDELRTQIEAGAGADEIEASWQADIESFREQRRPYLLYKDQLY